jgi:hypothetical protein
VIASSVDVNNSLVKPTTGRNADVPVPTDSDVGFVTVVNKKKEGIVCGRKTPPTVICNHHGGIGFH